jgi:hypothetical protein
MAIVQGIREKVHLPIYDSLSVEPGKQLRDAEPGSILKFFVDVQKKTKLETNLQSASLLPHYNTFEARAMRVVISDLPPTFPDKNGSDPKSKSDKTFQVLRDVEPTEATPNPVTPVEVDAKVKIALGVKRLMEMLEEARQKDDVVELDAKDDGVTKDSGADTIADGDFVELSIGDLEDLIDSLEKFAPPIEQIRPNTGAGTIIGKLIYNTVTTLFVGEKIMIQMPTWFFPAGAGPYSERGSITTHGEPSPTATFRFAEPIYIDKQQNFRVEIEVPSTDTLKEIQKIYGPMKLWVVLDGYMTRDVQ